VKSPVVVVVQKFVGESELVVPDGVESGGDGVVSVGWEAELVVDNSVVEVVLRAD
jgi:hypothetical protein